MGILDDAIREHLDLKRRHGAREAELRQLEDEAFGPPSRPGEPDFPPAAPAGPRDDTDEVALGESGTEAEIGPELAAPADVGAPGPATEVEQAEGPREGTEALREPEAEAAEEEPEGMLYDHAQEEDIDFGEVGIGLEDELAIEEQEAAAEETPAAELPVEEVPAEQEWAQEPHEAAEDEDVLEETPEFLRDAPEDEELWFEQGEPQDFDFDDEK
jgi:hypothetical protein